MAGPGWERGLWIWFGGVSQRDGGDDSLDVDIGHLRENKCIIDDGRQCSYCQRRGTNTGRGGLE